MLKTYALRKVFTKVRFNRTRHKILNVLDFEILRHIKPKILWIEKQFIIDKICKSAWKFNRRHASRKGIKIKIEMSIKCIVCF